MTTRGAEPAADHSADTNNIVRAAALRALADRVESGEDGRLLDAEVWAAVHGGYIEPNGHHGKSRRDVVWHKDAGWKKATISGHPWHDRKLLGCVDDAPRYLSSLDAVAALQEAVLPGRAMAAETDAQGKTWMFTIYRNEETGARGRQGSGATLCQAWLAALLRALAMEAERALTPETTP